MKLMKVMYVEWVDAVASSGWQDAEEIGEVHLIRSVGFLVKDSGLSISLAAASSGNQSNAIITIPKAWIRKKKHVKI